MGDEMRWDKMKVRWDWSGKWEGGNVWGKITRQQSVMKEIMKVWNTENEDILSILLIYPLLLTSHSWNMYPILSYQKSNPPKSPKTLTLLNISIHPSVPPLSTWAQHTSISTSQKIPHSNQIPKNKSQCKVPRTFKPLSPTAGHLFLSCHDPNKHSRKKYIYTSLHIYINTHHAGRDSGHL